jgi:hypothetical protein
MRFFRGLAIPTDRAEETVEVIEREGLVAEQGRWQMDHWHPGAIEVLFTKSDLSLEDTRPKGVAALPAVCGCGDEDGAAYYAWWHNRGEINDTPVMVEFEAGQGDVAVDGKDCLYTVFQMGDPERARDFLQTAFGTRALRYAEKAWASDDQGVRIALCDLAIHDPEIVEAHRANAIVIGGRHNTIFRSAFTVTLPVPAGQIVRVWVPGTEPVLRPPAVRYDELLRRR